MSRRKQLDKKFNDLSLKMQFFCISPDKDVYKDICNLTRIKMDIGDAFDIWKISVNHKHHYEDLGDEYDNVRTKLLKKLSEKTTASNVDNIWYMFFATGDTNLLVKLYEAFGNTTIPVDKREIFMDQWIQFKLEYKRKISDILTKDVSNTISMINPDLQRILDDFKQIDKMIETIETNDPKTTY